MSDYQLIIQKPKVSELIVDDDLDMGDHDIKTNTLRAQRVYSPIDTDEWPTETLDWGDTAETVQTLAYNHFATTPSVLFSANSGSESTRWVLKVTPIRFDPYVEPSVIQILVNDVEILDTGALQFRSYEFTFDAPANASIVVNHRSAYTAASCIAAGATLTDTGMVVGPKTFNLSGKWLALGLDMQGLAATVKIQGVEMPYSDYIKYFPLAPSEITIPGDWGASQVRPVIKVYV